MLTHIACGTQLTWPFFTIRNQCPMSEVFSGVDDRGLVGTQAPQSRVVTCFSEETT